MNSKIDIHTYLTYHLYFKKNNEDNLDIKVHIEKFGIIDTPNDHVENASIGSVTISYKGMSQDNYSSYLKALRFPKVIKTVVYDIQNKEHNSFIDELMNNEDRFMEPQEENDNVIVGVYLN